MQSQPPQVEHNRAINDDRHEKWSKYEAMKRSVVAACKRHLAIIAADQIRADEELVAKAQARGATK